MDYKKDISKGHKKDMNKEHDIVFEDNNVLLESLIKKTQKITSALYLVTDFIPNDDPIKLKLREGSLFVLSGISYYGVIKSNKNNAFLKVLYSISEVISLLEVSMMGGLISEMNSSILKKEYISLRSLMESRKNELIKDIVFDNNFFKESPEPLSFNNSQNIHENKRLSGKDDDIRPKIKEFKRLDVFGTPKHVAKHKENSDLIKSNRRNSIIKLLRENNDQLSVRDIAIYVKGYSEKTLQRDLISMVNEGIVIKKGERRWSRYSISH